MKKLFSILFLLIIIFSTGCSSESSTGTENTNPSTDNNKDFLNKDTIIPFSGFWLNEKYYNKILETKSPRESQDVVNFSAIEIPNRTLRLTSPILGFHEADDNFIVRNGNKYQLYSTYDSTKKFDIEVLNKNNRIKIGDNYFIRLKSSNILEEILFAGKYKMDNKTIEFTANGKIKGLAEFNLYEPLIDYIGPGSDVDIIFLDKGKDKLKYLDSNTYTFKFKEDSLYIYNYKCIEFDSTNNECGEAAYGDIKYKMKKL